MIFAVFDVLLQCHVAVNVCINCSLLHLLGGISQLNNNGITLMHSLTRQCTVYRTMPRNKRLLVHRLMVVYIAVHFNLITGSAVALHCCKAHERINRKTGNSTPCKIVTPENFGSKIDYVGDGNYYANFCENRFSGASPQKGEI